MSDIESMVRVDLHVIFKIIQDLSDVPHSDIPLSAGALIGVPQEGYIDITNSFPFPKSNYTEYNSDMMMCLEKEGYESLIIGLYTATLVDSFISEDFLNKLYLYQSAIKKCVVLVFDYLKISSGILDVKAYRLSPEALDIISSKDSTPQNLRNPFHLQDLLNELPVYIHISKLSYVLLEKLKILTKQPLEFIGLDRELVLDKKYYLLMKSIDELSQDYHNIQNNLRKIYRQYTLMEQTKMSKDTERHSEINFEEDDAGSIPIINRLMYSINKWNSEYLNDQIYSISDDLKDVTSMIDGLVSAIDDITL